MLITRIGNFETDVRERRPFNSRNRWPRLNPLRFIAVILFVQSRLLFAKVRTKDSVIKHYRTAVYFHRRLF